MTGSGGYVWESLQYSVHCTSNCRHHFPKTNWGAPFGNQDKSICSGRGLTQFLSYRDLSSALSRHQTPAILQFKVNLKWLSDRHNRSMWLPVMLNLGLLTAVNRVGVACRPGLQSAALFIIKLLISKRFLSWDSAACPVSWTLLLKLTTCPQSPMSTGGKRVRYQKASQHTVHVMNASVKFTSSFSPRPCLLILCLQGLNFPLQSKVNAMLFSSQLSYLRFQHANAPLLKWVGTYSCFTT